MKIECDRDGLLRACQLANGALKARSPKEEVTSVFKAVASDDRLTVVATNLTVGLRYHLLGVGVREAGEAVLPSQQLTRLLSESPPGGVTLDCDADRSLITTETGEFEVPAHPADGFPDVAEPEGKFHLTARAGDLKLAVKRTHFASSAEDTKYTLRGILFEPGEQSLRLVATDGRRLAVADCPATYSQEPVPQPALIPRESVALLAPNLPDDEEPVEVYLTPTWAAFRTPKATVTTRLVEGRFAPYRDILPRSPAHKADLPVGPLHAAVRQAAVMADEQHKRVVWKFDLNKLTLLAKGASTGGRSKVELAVPFRDTVEIAFDPNYVTDFLRVLESSDVETVVLEMTDGGRPALFRAGPEYQYLLMPLT